MHINPFDAVQNVHSPIHRLDPRVKVVAALAFIISNAILPDGLWLGFGLMWLMVLATAFIAKLPLKLLLGRALIIIPFLFAAVTVLFTLPGRTLWTGPFGLTLSDTGLIRFLSIFLRSWISVQIAVILTATTPFPDLLHALRHLRMPAILVAILAFMYRYLFVLADEAGRLLRARAARSARLPGTGKHGGTLRWRATIAGNMVGNLFIRSFERSDRVYRAMIARGYRGQLLTMNPHTMTPLDWLIGAIFLLLLLAIQLLRLR